MVLELANVWDFFSSFPRQAYFKHIFTVESLIGKVAGVFLRPLFFIYRDIVVNVSTGITILSFRCI